MTIRIAAAVCCLCLAMQLPIFAQEFEQEVDPFRLAKKAQTILETTCHRCHGLDGTVEGGFSYLLDREQLVARKQIMPGAAAESKIMQRIHSKEMPPAGEDPQLTDEQIAVLTKWIDAGAVDFDPPKAARNFVSPDQMFRAMLADIQTLSEFDRPFVRYLTLTHLYNAGRSEDELHSFRHGITKLVNSLSWGRRIEAPVPLADQPTILRIDLRHYKWSGAVWDKLASSDPYGMVFPDSADARQLYQETRCELPNVRGDWFVATASRPPLYHEILQLPETEAQLERLIHVDVAENIRTGQAMRAAFNGSAVSRNNRMIERHESSYGYYWKSYDFATNVGRQNLFSHPLGPGTAAGQFKHDGGELIFSLPNGFQGYLLVDEAGNRIDKGPIQIVSDPKQPDRAVENGLSCMSCHVHGLLPKDDQVRIHVQKNPEAFSKEEIGAVLALYPERDRFHELLQDDSNQFRQALASAKMPPAVSEPIKALETVFRAELDLPLAAAEAQLEIDEFTRLLQTTPTLARVLGALQIPGGTVQREVFASSFADLAHASNVGQMRVPGIGRLASGKDVQNPANAEMPAAAAPTPQPKFHSTIIEATENAPANWLFKEARAGAPIYQDRDYTFEKFPDEMIGGTLVLREGTAGWLEPGSIRATKACSVYALIRLKEHGKEQIDEVTLVKFAREGWEEVDGEVKTSVDVAFDTHWVAIRKDVSAGEVFLQLDTIDYGRRAAIFVFKEGGRGASDPMEKMRTGSQRLPKGAFRSTVVELTERASPNWIFKEARVGTQTFQTRPWAFAKLPEETVGGTLVFREGQAGWLEPGTIRAIKDATVYAILRWKQDGEVEIDEVTLVKFAREGWEEVEGEITIDADAGNDTRWLILSKNVPAGEVSLQLDSINYRNRAALFVFKESDPRTAVSTSSTAAKPGTHAWNQRLPKKAFRSSVAEFTDKASPDWIFKEARVGAQILSDRGYLFTQLPPEIQGGTLVWRDSSAPDWLPPGSIRMLKDGTVYAIVHTRQAAVMGIAEDKVNESALAAIVREGWEEVDEVKTTYPNGEGWRWHTFRKKLAAGDTNPVLQDNKLGRERRVLFVFK